MRGFTTTVGTGRVPMASSPSRGFPRKLPLPGIKHVLLVASGKGGVGKSTIAGG